MGIKTIYFNDEEKNMAKLVYKIREYGVEM